MDKNNFTEQFLADAELGQKVRHSQELLKYKFKNTFNFVCLVLYTIVTIVLLVIGGYGSVRESSFEYYLIPAVIMSTFFIFKFINPK